MKIGINSRIYQNPSAGIPYTIERLYKKVLTIDKKNSYIFFQTSKKKTIGKTLLYTRKNPNSLLTAVLFDNFYVRKLAQKSRVRIFHGVSNTLPFFKTKGIRYVVTIYDLAFLTVPQKGSKLFNFYYKYIVGHALHNADVVVSISKNTKKDILKYYKIDEKKIHVISLGVDNDFFIPRVGSSPFKFKYFFSITTHPKRKNILSVIQTMKGNSLLKDYTYVIAGVIPKNQIDELTALIKDLKLIRRVKILGYVTQEELIRIYQYAEFFIYPSFYEGFGFPVLEAMACKCITITSNNSSLTEITPNSDFLVDPYSIDSISKKISKVINLSEEEKEKIRETNYSFAKKFSWDICARKYIELFNNL